MPSGRADTVELRDGSRVAVRPIHPQDKGLLVGAFERMSEESRYRRFFQPVHSLSKDALRFLTEVDHHDHEALVALDRSTGDALGVARYVRSVEVPSRAEVAVAVVDDWQRRGLGTELLERLVDRAREEAVTNFTALVQAENPSAVRVLSTLGATQRHRQGNEVELDIELPPDEGIGRDLAELLRSAAGSALHPRGTALRLARRARQFYERASSI
ncbi:MAG: GNAT family N-acetyltransferase [Actinomycetota bacterium]|nr:GNAT family N-acetyltransferase [Actinomycetota bacterium]